MQFVITLDWSAYSQVTDADTKRFFRSLSMQDEDTNMLIVHSDKAHRNICDIRCAPIVARAVIASIYALVSGAVNYKPSFVQEVSADLGRGFFLRMCKKATTNDVHIMSMNQDSLNPKDMLYLNGGRDEVDVQFVLNMPKDGVSFSDMSNINSRMDLNIFAYLNKLILGVDSNMYAKVDLERELVQLVNKTTDEPVDINMLDERKYMPIKMAFETLINRKSRVVTVIDMNKVDEDVLRRLLDFFSEIKNVFCILTNNTRNVKFGQTVITF